MSLVQKFLLKKIVDPRGEIVIAEAQNEIPFEIRRIYFLKNLQSSHPRGFHAHKKLKQLAVCLTGSCKMILDNGHEKEIVHMDNSSEGILIDAMIWHEMYDFSSDCVFLVFADNQYDESDYIRNYSDFIGATK